MVMMIMNSKNRRRTMVMGLIALMSSFSACEKSDPDPIDPQEGKDVGDAANVLLESKNFSELKMKIFYPAGHAPEDRAIDTLEAFLNKRLHKPGGIEVEQEEIDDPGKSTFTVSGLEALEEKHRESYTDQSGGITASFLFVNAGYEEDTDDAKTLGLAYGATSMAIFSENIKEFSGGINQPPEWKLEATVMEHEVGHILGLVNAGTDMVNDHQDDPHGKHCDDENCLMYYATETSDVVGNLLGSPIPSLDDNCLDDLKAAGGK